MQINSVFKRHLTRYVLLSEDCCVRLPSFLLATTFVQVLVSCIALAQPSFRGFDRNDYPGDAALPVLKKSFAFTGYWLNDPPGETQNSWAGKRAVLTKQGFGFVVLFNGRAYAKLRGKDGTAIGAADGIAAAAAAAKEGFAKNVLIFLDQEEGGRLLPEQLAYIFGWVDAVSKLGARAGVYCSGIDVPDGNGKISTARQLALEEERRAKQPDAPKRLIALWVANDQCPPAPGCVCYDEAAFDGVFV